VSDEPQWDDACAADFEKLLGDVAEALATGREPEDVQRERHERELRDLKRRLRRR
jgi:hypothetical protein